MRISRLFFAAASAALLMVALPANQSRAGDAPADAPWRRVVYTCDSGQSLTVAYRDSGSAARVMVADQPAVKLVSRPVKSGFRYGADRYELRGDGDAVTWQIGSKAPLKCTSVDPATGNLAAAAAR